MEKQKFNRFKPDYFLMFTILVLLIIGMIMVYSSSYIWAEYKYNDQFFFLKRQVLFALVGILGMFLMLYIPYHTLKSYARPLLIVCFILLILVIIPGIGMVRGGARSWIGIGSFSLQPAEFIKIGLIVYLASFIHDRHKQIQSLTKGFLPSVGLVFLAFGLIMLQPDLGTGIVLVGTCMLMIFIGGAKFKHFFTLSIIGLLAFIGLILAAPYRIKRITSFLDPWNDPLGDGFQIIQSLYAIGPGGLIGSGLGNGLQKYFYLPEPQTDFIFSILAEELGFLGGIITIGLFAIVLWRGVRISLNAPDLFAKLLALGIVFMLTIQVFINISVVIGLIPVTGITLPFLSYGGSSLTLTLISVGILLNVSRYVRL